jgi:hypothetical protein
MQKHPEISIPNAYEIYHGKNVLFRVKRARGTTDHVGSIVVSPNSNWMRIVVKQREDEKEFSVQMISLDQAIAESIQPAPNQVKAAYPDQVDFVIPGLLVLPHRSK